MTYNLANFLRTAALPVTLRDRLVKIGAKIVRHSRSITFQMAVEENPATIAALLPLPLARPKEGVFGPEARPR